MCTELKPQHIVLRGLGLLDCFPEVSQAVAVCLQREGRKVNSINCCAPLERPYQLLTAEGQLEILHLLSSFDILLSDKHPQVGRREKQTARDVASQIFQIKYDLRHLPVGELDGTEQSTLTKTKILLPFV